MQHSNFELAVSFKTLLKRALVGVIVLGCVALLVLSIKQEGFTDQLRAQMGEWLAPITSFFSAPVSLGKTGVAQVDSYFSVREENTKLKEENQALLFWQQRAASLEQENRALRTLGQAKAREDIGYVTGLVTAMEGGAYREAVKVNIGAQDGVEIGAAVVNETGFVGRIIEVQEAVSWLLLLQDVNSRIPVRNARNSERAIVMGGRGNALRLGFLGKEADFVEGDVIVTAADGEVLPDGIPVGTVMKGEEKFHITPYAQPSRLHYVRVLSKDAPLIVPEMMGEESVDEVEGAAVFEEAE